MELGHDLHELVELVRLAGDRARTDPDALVGRVAEQLERQLFGVAPYELLERRIEPRNRDLGELRLLVERELGRVELHVVHFVLVGPDLHQQRAFDGQTHDEPRSRRST